MPGLVGTRYPSQATSRRTSKRLEMASDDAFGGEIYERYLGRWSRRIADDFVCRLGVPAGAAWLDVACGTGALTHAILAACAPAAIDCSDFSDARASYARRATPDPRVTFELADACDLPYGDDRYDAVVSGLPFPSIEFPRRAIAEFVRVVKPGGLVGLYVWDFAGMQMLRLFWDAAIAFDAEADEPDTDESFTICAPEPLADAFRDAGLGDVEVSHVAVPTRFRDFDDYWLPFTSGTAPAQAHVQSLTEKRRAALRDRLRKTLPIEPDGSISLIARTWAVKGRKS